MNNFPWPKSLKPAIRMRRPRTQSCLIELACIESTAGGIS